MYKTVSPKEDSLFGDDHVRSRATLAEWPLWQLQRCCFPFFFQKQTKNLRRWSDELNSDERDEMLLILRHPLARLVCLQKLRFAPGTSWFGRVICIKLLYALISPITFWTSCSCWRESWGFFLNIRRVVSFLLQPHFWQLSVNCCPHPQTCCWLYSDQ